MEVSKCWKIVVFQEVSLKMKNCKTFHEAQTASCLKGIIQSPRNPQPTLYQIKPHYIIEIKIFLRRYAEIYIHYLLLRYFKNAAFMSVKKWCSANVFSDTKQKHVCLKMCKVRKVLTVLREYIIFNVKWVGIRKMSEIFWAKLYCKMSDIIC